MKKLVAGLLLFSAPAWATYIPVNGSSVTVYAPNNNTTAIPVSGTLSVNALPTGTNNIGTVTGSSVTILNTAGGTLAISGSLSANQSVNVSQINAVTPLMGNGATGTGSSRVTLSNDNTAIANWGQGATGSAVPSGAIYQAGIAKTSLPTAATDGNLVGSMRDKFGRVVVTLACPREIFTTTGTILTSNTNETVLLSSGTAGVLNDPSAIIVTNTSATGSLLTFRSNGNGTTSTLHFYAEPTTSRGFTLPSLWPQGTAAANWTVQSSASVASVYVDMAYCQNK